jgi:alkylmercury lyase|tara:strand:+ start:624 stop:1295 length:672 start_codon:yes stop_codon:yes gene_type:complete
MSDQAQHDRRDDFRDYLRDGHFLAGASHLIPLTLALYRLLGEGVPVRRTAVPKRLGLSPAEVDGLLDDVPRSTVDFDATGAITAFGGLSLTPANHRFKVGNRELHTWCVFDALFLPEILDEPATASTRCPTTGETIEIEMTPRAIVTSRPSESVMSIVAPDRAACCDDLRGVFCNHVNLFVDAAAFRTWAGDRDDVGLVTLNEAYQLARQRNEYRYGDLLRAQ